MLDDDNPLIHPPTQGLGVGHDAVTYTVDRRPKVRAAKTQSPVFTGMKFVIPAAEDAEIPTSTSPLSVRGVQGKIQDVDKTTGRAVAVGVGVGVGVREGVGVRVTVGEGPGVAVMYTTS